MRPRPSSPRLSTTFSNCSGSSSRPSVVTGIWNAEPSGTGGWPIVPDDTWMFCSRSACTTSLVVMLRAASRSGSSQTRMLYSRSPNSDTSPTPSMRASESRIWISA